jgi:hypothetical protein
MKCCLRAGGIVLVTLGAIAPLAGGDWPWWRGPKRDGCSTDQGLLTEWPAGGPPLAWKATGCGVGYSSVSVVGDRLFTMGDGPDGSHVLAFEVKSGRLAWRSELVGKAGGDPAGTRSTPSVDGGCVYALGQYGDLVCLNAATGREFWRRSLTRDFGGRYHDWLYAESPLLDREKVVATPGGPRGAIVALNRRTGALLWQSAEFKDPAHYSSLIAADIDGLRQYIQLTAESVAGVAADNGRLVWRANRHGVTAVVPTPVYADHQVYVTSGYGVGCQAFRIARDAAGFKAEPAYANQVMVNHHGGVVLVAGYVYGHSDSKGWVCQDFKTGAVVWSHHGVGKGSLCCADGHLYLRSESGGGTLALVEASPRAYAEKGRFEQPNRSDKNSWVHPVVANGRLYLRDQEVLLCYDVEKK